MCIYESIVWEKDSERIKREEGFDEWIWQGLTWFSADDDSDNGQTQATDRTIIVERHGLQCFIFFS